MASLRVWCSRSALFNSAWGFGLSMVMVSLIIRLSRFDNVCQLQDVSLCSWRLGGTSLGIFGAGSGAYLFVKSRHDKKLVKTILVAGVTFILVFPLSAVALVAWEEIDYLVRRYSLFSPVRNPFGELLASWWGNLWLYGIWYLLGIVVCSAAYFGVPRIYKDTDAHTANVSLPHAMPRRRDLVVGALLIVFGFVIADLSKEVLLSQLQLAITIAKAWNKQELWERVAESKRNLWPAVCLISLPYIVVGALLWAPFGRRRQQAL